MQVHDPKGVVGPFFFLRSTRIRSCPRLRNPERQPGLAQDVEELEME